MSNFGTMIFLDRCLVKGIGPVRFTLKKTMSMERICTTIMEPAERYKFNTHEGAVERLEKQLEICPGHPLQSNLD